MIIDCMGRSLEEDWTLEKMKLKLFSLCIQVQCHQHDLKYNE
jgi:hypothetical protein